MHAAWSEDTAPLAIPPDLEAFLGPWIDTDGAGCCDLLGITASWWAQRARANALLLHYSAMLQDLPGTVRRLAAFIGGVDAAALDVGRIAARSSFAYMSGRAEAMAPFGGAHLSSAQAFFVRAPSARSRRR